MLNFPESERKMQDSLDLSAIERRIYADLMGERLRVIAGGEVIALLEEKGILSRQHNPGRGGFLA